MLDAADEDPRPLLGNFRRDFWLPHYPSGACGAWSVRQIMMAAARGYWGEVYKVNGSIILSGPGQAGRAAWMSITPSEIESQEIGLVAAYGHTVVLGLGMGWLAGNAALSPKVERVTVVEQDKEILDLIESLRVFDQLPPEARAKLDIVHGDALDWRPSVPVDTLQADIWEKFTEDNKLAHARRMQENIAAKSIYFWGQEMEIWRAAEARGGDLDWPLLHRIVEEDIALPLILPDWPDYPQKIAAAAKWWYRTN